MRVNLLKHLPVICQVLAVLACVNACAIKSASPASDFATAIRSLKPESGIWHEVDKHLVELLWKADFPAVEKAFRKSPVNLPVSLAQFDLAVRAGHRKEALQITNKLAKQAEFRNLKLAGSLLGFLTSRKEWDIALNLFWASPPETIGAHYELADYVAKTRGDSAANKLWERMASTGDSEWMHRWIYFLSRHGGAEKILGRLEANVRAHPEAIGPALAYIQAVQSDPKKHDLNWMGEVCKPKLATENYQLGRSLVNAGSPNAAIIFLNRSLAADMTKEDFNNVVFNVQSLLGMNAEKVFRSWTRNDLIHAYRAINRPDLAQPLIHLMAKDEIAGQGISSSLARVAGEVQPPDKQNVIEETILSEEKSKANSPEYWLMRANYYAGRDDYEKAGIAFKNALKLCPIDEPVQRSKGGTLREGIFHDYCRYLRSTERIDEIVKLCRLELELSSPKSSMRFAAMRQLIDLDSRIYGTRKRVGGAAAPEGPDESGKRAKIINYDDELLWKVISEDEDWDNGGSCLRRMLEHAPAAQVAVILSRAESLAGNSNPKRILNLVGLYRNYGPDTRKRVFTNESSLRREVLDSNTSNNLHKILSLLQNALRQSTGSNAIAEVREQLLDVYLQLGQYANAEEEFNKLAAAQTPDPLLLKKMAVLTMESADRERAMRLWKLAVKLDPADLRGIQVLAYFGLHDDLLRYYQEYQKADHESWIPTEALKLIHAPFRGPRWAEFQVN